MLMATVKVETYRSAQHRINKDGTMDNPRVIGERLKQLRIGLGHEHSSAGFARLIGLTPQAWNHYETGKRRISLDEANKLVQRFGLPLDWIYLGVAEDRIPVHIARALGLVVDAPTHSRRGRDNSR